MPVPLRRFYAQKLVDAKKEESNRIKKASQPNQNQIQRPGIQKS
jgi:hypothetical protein|tara:strand:+ start:774 stop:905 length:132 start_codon:yes stop_codon:yes gene_type:complete